MDFNIILIFGCVMGFFILLGMSFKSGEPVKVTERLQKVQGTSGGRKSIRDQDVMDQSLVVRVIIPMADKWGKLFSGITPAGMLELCRKSISSAGLNNRITPIQLATISWMLMIFLPSFLFLLTAMGHRDRNTWFMIAIFAMLGYRLPMGIVQGKAKKRLHEIQKALPFTFDLIGIAVEAGLSFDSSMSMVAEKLTGPLSDELNTTLNEIRLGKSRNDALQALANRIDLEDLRNFLIAVIYISRMGGSLVEVIRVQTDALRVKRRQRAEEKAMRAPVKIMIPLVLFIFPTLFIVILGPAVAGYMKNM